MRPGREAKATNERWTQFVYNWYSHLRDGSREGRIRGRKLRMGERERRRRGERKRERRGRRRKRDRGGLEGE